MRGLLHSWWHAQPDESGGALLAVVALTITVTVVIGGILTLEAAQQRLFRRETLRLQARYEAERCVALAMHDLNQGRALPFEVLETQPARDGLPNRRIEGRVVPYGLFALADCTGIAAREGHHLVSLIGEALSEVYDAALVLADGEGGLTVADTATIEGTAYVGVSGIGQAVVARRPYRGTLSGQVVASRETRLPDFDAGAATRALHTWSEYARGDVSPYPLHTAPPVLTEESLAAAKEMELVIFASSGDVTLRGPLRLPPFTAIVSPGSIHIEGDVRLDNALLVAKDSIIVAGAGDLAPRGAAQLIAGQRVNLQGAARLLYPSAIAIAGEGDEARITLADSARVDGFIFGGGASEVVLREKTLVRGAVLAPGSAELRGSVHGSVLARQLHTHYEGTYYVGWLIGGSIRAPLRPAPYVLPARFGDESDPIMLGQHTLPRPHILRRR